MKITKEHFEIYKKECEKWVEIFGLKNWQINYIHKKVDVRSRVIYNCVDGMATFILSTHWSEESGYEFNVGDVRRAAFHEVCEVLLSRLADMVEQRYALHIEDTVEETHRIIRILENVLWKESK